MVDGVWFETNQLEYLSKGKETQEGSQDNPYELGISLLNQRIELIEYMI